jgi:hypothetical protein
MSERTGPVWQDEYYDRIVRDTIELEKTIEYIMLNPSQRWPDHEQYPWVKVFEG